MLGGIGFSFQGEDMKEILFTLALVLLLASPSFAELGYTRFTIRFGLSDPRSWSIVHPPLPYADPSMLNPVDKAAAKKLDELNKSVTYSCLLLQSPDYRVSGNLGDYLNIFAVKKCEEVRANLAPVGSNAFCATPCAQDFSP